MISVRAKKKKKMEFRHSESVADRAPAFMNHDAELMSGSQPREETRAPSLARQRDSRVRKGNC